MNPKRTLSVEGWRSLAGEGVDIPIQICLAGESMRPLIRKGKDPVTILPLHRPPKRGDVVLFADDRGRYVVHRVWKVGAGVVITLGDHCDAPDAPMPPEQIWGLVTEVRRNGRRIPLDNGAARLLGRLWMDLLPLRRRYYQYKRRGKTHGNQADPS